jgi:tetratricopeptide (TPR) repeat protein
MKNVVVLLALVACGCRTIGGDAPHPRDAVQIDARVLSETNDKGEMEFVTRAARAAQFGGEPALNRCVAHFPDRAGAIAARAPATPIESAIADSYARVCGSHAALASLLDHAETCAASGDQAGARAALDDASKIDSCDPALWQCAIAVATRIGSPTEAGFIERKAQCELTRGEVPNALEDWQRARALAPSGDAQRIDVEIARTLHALRRDVDARAKLEAASTSSNVLVQSRALALAGVIAASDDRLDEAIDSFRTALSTPERWPGDTAARADLGAALARAGKLDEALKEIETARSQCEADGNLIELARTLGNESVVLGAAGRDREAAEATDRARTVAREAGYVPER